MKPFPTEFLLLHESSNVFASVFKNDSEPSGEELKRNRFGKLSKAHERTNASNGKPLVEFQGSSKNPQCRSTHYAYVEKALCFWGCILFDCNAFDFHQGSFRQGFYGYGRTCRIGLFEKGGIHFIHVGKITHVG